MRISGASRYSVLAVLAGISGALAAPGCSSPGSATRSAAESSGAIGLELQAAGLTLTSVTYTIIGNGFSKSGVIDVTNGTQIASTIGGIPAGNGYAITLSAVDAGNSGTSCVGSASFNVLAGATTSALVHLTCKTPARTGSVQLNGTLNLCPNIDSLSVQPAETTVGHSVSLSAAASDGDQAPSALSYVWSSTGGTLTGATSANPLLVCTAVGPVTVTLIVSDGDCTDTATQTVTCSPASGAGAGGAGGTAGMSGSASGGSSGSSGSSGSTTGGAAGSGAGGSGGSSGSSGSASGGEASASAGAGGSAGGGEAGTGAGAPLIKINEVESNGGIPGDWTELYNAGSSPVDISGWIFRDNDDTHAYFIPQGTVVAPGGYYVLEVANFVFGLGAPDATRLYDSQGTLVDSYSWTTHATTTYGRCPNGVGDFVTTASSTKGAANDCGTGGSGGSGGGGAGSAGSAGAGGGAGSAGSAGAGGTSAGAGGSAGSAGSAGAGGSASAFAPWPGGNAVVTVDNANVFGTNLSGLIYEPGVGVAPPVLWGIQNGPSKLYRLLFDGAVWAPDANNGWSTGKTLFYPTGLGGPDSEGVTKAAFGGTGLYVSTERDNTNNTVSRLSVLLYDGGTSDSAISATKEWNLTGDLPTAGANLGLEAIAWVPDSYLVAKGFIDESTSAAYDPTRYGNHADGVFFVGLEQNGIIYGYALDHVGGGFQRVATISSGNPSIMDLSFDRDVGYLWAACDNTCNGRTNVLDIDTRLGSSTLGRFYIRQGFERPSTMPNLNNEGFTVTPESTCQAGFKAVFYADDDNDGGHAMRGDSIPCGAFL